MSRLGSLGAHLYRGEVSYDFIARRKIWYTLSAIVLLISIVSLFTRGLTLGIEFRGGAEFRVTSPTATESNVESTVAAEVHGNEIVVQKVGSQTIRVQTETLTSNQLEQVRHTLAQRFHVSENSVSTQFIGPSWGHDISTKALRALIIFLVGVVIFLSLYFEWKMAAAAMIALLHDLVITAGLYSLSGFEVTPSTVIGFLTILGYSLYDTVVVFDKVRENTAGLAGGSRLTYSQAANLAVNQTLVRSINTSIIALLPIAAILFAGTALLGSGPLKDLALALFIGVAVGAYSSIFIATPLLAGFKEREPAMQALAKRVAARRSGTTTDSPSARRRAAAESAAAPEETDVVPSDTEEREAVPAGTTATRPAQPQRPSGSGQGSQRNQPRKGSGGRNKSKKRR
ncbi:MAG TPA: protein translocase subunit SecF [Actinomycetes bacterium]|jgi:preprotein translocase subunit SecF|nr:protein translocase subunit SecF [Actinomycetes bacterium]